MDAANPETSPPTAAAAVTARTYVSAAVVVEMWAGSAASRVAAPGRTTPIAAARKPRAVIRNRPVTVVLYGILMGAAHILISSLHASLNTRVVIVANFLAGLLVGTLLGLALAPIVRAWLTWKTVEEARRTDDRTTEPIDSDGAERLHRN
jgi:hypothetical protein